MFFFKGGGVVNLGRVVTASGGAGRHEEELAAEPVSADCALDARDGDLDLSSLETRIRLTLRDECCAVDSLLYLCGSRNVLRAKALDEALGVGVDALGTSPPLPGLTFAAKPNLST